MNIIPRGISILELYRMYRTDELIVNRKYQRKLVWTLEEKRALIDSIFSQYPIPLILLAEIKENDDESTKYEIIDGIQRLNAIFSFIENEFNLNNKYFDVDVHPFAKAMAKEGLFHPINSLDILKYNEKECANLLEYQLSVTIYQGSEEDINEIFGRINSYGKKLSDQEVRQAGVVTEFSDLVRELGAEIRGDVSKEVLSLSIMPKISVDSNKLSLGYGVLAEDTFWCKQGILNSTKLRNSEDEQLIADIALSIIYDNPFAASKENFDDCYGKGKSKLKKMNEVETKLSIYNKDNLKYDIKFVFDRIKEIINSFSSEKNYLKNILNPDAGSNPVKEPFYTVFMAFYQLMIKEQKIPFDYKNIMNNLCNVAKNFSSKGHTIASSTRKKNIKITKALIEDYFRESKDSIRSIGTLSLDFENFMRLARMENAKYDFKQGFYMLNPKERKFDNNSFEKIMHNICALANFGYGEKGYLFMGVADTEKDTSTIEYLDKIKADKFYEFGIVGLEREAKIKGCGLDKYIQSITEKISFCALPENLKIDVLSSMKTIPYRDKVIIMFEVTGQKEPSWYNGNELFIRKGANCCLVKDGNEIASVFNRFNK